MMASGAAYKIVEVESKIQCIVCKSIGNCAILQKSSKYIFLEVFIFMPLHSRYIAEYDPVPCDSRCGS